MTSHQVPSLRVEHRDPRTLTAAPWNPNRADPSDEAKLDASIRRIGMFKPVICRELPDGTLQILGGHYRAASAIRIGITEVPVVNLGEVPEKRAREITLIDNGRYGRDDAGALSDLFAELGESSDALASFLPYDLSELAAFQVSAEIDLDSLGLDEEDAPAAEDKVPRAAKTHEVMRMKVAIDDADFIRKALQTVMADQGFSDADQLTNAGDALVWLVRDWAKAGGGL